jgi:hypothetical protein
LQQKYNCPQLQKKARLPGPFLLMKLRLLVLLAAALLALAGFLT